MKRERTFDFSIQETDLPMHNNNQIGNVSTISTSRRSFNEMLCGCEATIKCSSFAISQESEFS